MKKTFWLWTVGLVLFMLAGCDMGLVVGSKAVGVRSGSFVYSEGYMVCVYNDDFDRVWRAVEKVYGDMKAVKMERERKIGKGTLVGYIHDEKVTMKLEFKEKDRTEVAVLVGLGGNNIAAQLLHDKIAQELSKNHPGSGG